MTYFRSISLGAKLNLALLVFLLVLGAATAAIIIFGFSRTQDDATERSQDALEEQGRLALLALVDGVSQSGGLQVEWAAEVGHRAGRYLQEFRASGAIPVLDTSRFVRTEEGIWYDPDPGRASDVVVPNHVEALGPAHLDDIAYSAALDPLLPALVEGFPGQLSGEGFRPIAVIFVGVNGVGRYYPPIGIQESTPAELDVSDFFDRFGPIANPERRTTWTPPYEDLNGRGLVITAQTPIYEGDGFRGIFEVDLSIDKLVDEINGIQPTARSFAFYVDTEGEIMRSDAFELLSTEATDNRELASILEAMKEPSPGSSPVVEQLMLGGEAYFIAYAPMPALGGSIAAAAPVSEITAQAAEINAGIDDEANRTFWLMLAAMSVLFVAGLAGATYLNRRAVLRPISELLGATRAVAGGNLSVNVPVDRGDELGQLGESFNTMVEQLRESERALEQRVEARTRELQALLEMSKGLASTLELQPLLNDILDHLKSLVDYAGASVLLRQRDDLVQLVVRRPAYVGPVDPVAARRAVQSYSTLWETIERGEPVIIGDVRGDSPFAEAYRAQVGYDLALTPLSYIRAWAAVPLITRDRVIGMLAMAHEEPDGFDERDVDLAAAVAAQAAVAIENARLFEEQQRQARDMEALTRADAELFRSLSLDRVLQALVDVTVDVLGADKSVVVLHQGDIDVVRAARNYAEDNLTSFNQALSMMPHEEPPPEGRKPEVYVDISQAPDFIAQALAREGITSHISIPVHDARRMLGVFGISFLKQHEFTDEEQRLYCALADRAAVAIQNAELYERAQQAASLEERQRLARELHDSVSQALYGIALGAGTARLRIDENPKNAAEPIEYVMSLAQAGLAEMRALIFELRPESLESEGVVAAIEKQVASARARHNIDIEFDAIDEPECRLDVKEALYRIAQEALHNVVKHADARHVQVRLEGAGEGSLILTVQDDGRGFDPAGSFPGHIGLHSMQERAERVGGSVTLESRPGAGTRVLVRVPLER